MKFKFAPVLILTLAAFFGPANYTRSTASNAFSVMVGDKPAECLSLENIRYDNGNYILIDGRNNTGRVKIISPDGKILNAFVSSIPLPDSASLPPDSPPSPFGTDRCIATSDSFVCTPAKWSGRSAEFFDRKTGEFRKSFSEIGPPIIGMTQSRSGDLWAVTSDALVDLSVVPINAINLASAGIFIDNAVAHPLGFVVLSQPNLFMIEPGGFVRWRIPLNEIIDGFVSPIDFAVSENGTTVLIGCICDLTDEEVDDYISLRSDLISASDIDRISNLENSVRDIALTDYAAIFIKPSGEIADVLRINEKPIACDSDSSARAHILTRNENGWSIFIIDPKIDQPIKVCDIPYGTPSIVSPHRISADSSGRVFWDDLAPVGENSQYAIFSYKQNDKGSLFKLGDSTDEPDLFYSENLPGLVRITTALGIRTDGSVLVGYTDFFADTLAFETDNANEFPASVPSEEKIASSSIMEIDPTGKLVDKTNNSETENENGHSGIPIDFIASGNSILAIFRIDETLRGYLIQPDGTMNEIPDFPSVNPLEDARMVRINRGYVGWFLKWDDPPSTKFFTFDENLSDRREIGRLEKINCRLIAGIPDKKTFFATIDGCEIFKIDSDNMEVTGVLYNRLESGVPAHPIDDAVWADGKLMILDREHRAILSVDTDFFENPPSAFIEDTESAIAVIRSALSEYYKNMGEYPLWYPTLLDVLLDDNDRDLVNRFFIAGRIYDYRVMPTGYSFLVWSAAYGQPVLYCDQNQTIETR
ncbi:MAG: hypothetical protein ABIC40_02150 [bacterium]